MSDHRDAESLGLTGAIAEIEKRNGVVKFTWLIAEMACGTVRHRLYRNGLETRWFVDNARYIAHYTNGEPCGLFGAGMGERVRRRDGSSYQIAACFGSFSKIADAKALAMSNAAEDRL